MSKEKRNPGVYFEIPVLNMERAVHFYSELFAFTFDQEEFDGIQMAYFPLRKSCRGLTVRWQKGKSINLRIRGYCFICILKIWKRP